MGCRNIILSRKGQNNIEAQDFNGLALEPEKTEFDVCVEGNQIILTVITPHHTPEIKGLEQSFPDVDK